MSGPRGLRYSSAVATEPTPELGPDEPLDRDLYCPACNYNLRGLTGEPFRCPECGGQFLRYELRVPKQRRVLTCLELKRRYLGGCADLCAMAVLPGLLGAWGFAFASTYTRPLFMPVTITSAIIWLAGFTLFARGCHGLPKWGWALAVYHVAGIPAMVCALFMVVVGWGLGVWACASAHFHLLDRIAPRFPGSPIADVAMTILMVIVTILTGLGAAWLVVRYEPMFWLKRLSGSRLDALAQQLVDRLPAPVNDGGSG